MGTKPTKEQVAKEIAALKAMKPKVRACTAFGEDNHAAIDAQLDVLERRLTDDEIYDAYEPKDDDGEPDDNGPRHELDHALDARRWLDGDDSDISPSKSWSPLVQK